MDGIRFLCAVTACMILYSFWHSWSLKWRPPIGRLCSCLVSAAWLKSTGCWERVLSADRGSRRTPLRSGRGRCRRHRRKPPVWTRQCCGGGSPGGWGGTRWEMCLPWSSRRRCCNAPGPGPASLSCWPCCGLGNLCGWVIWPISVLYLTGIYWGGICKMGSCDIRGSLSWEGRYSWSMHEKLMEYKLVSNRYSWSMHERLME